jgi:hypothetical protein
MKSLRLAIYILLFYARGNSQNLFAWKKVKSVLKNIIISKVMINSDQQNFV